MAEAERAALADWRTHVVTVTVDDRDEEWPDVEVRMVCTAPPDAECRTYPVCDCEVFSVCEDPEEHAEREHTATGRHDEEGHPYEPGRDCWVKSWFDLGDEGHVYVGADANDARDDGVPAVVRSGEVDVTGFVPEGYVEWQWHYPHRGFTGDPGDLITEARAAELEAAGQGTLDVIS